MRSRRTIRRRYVAAAFLGFFAIVIGVSFLPDLIGGGDSASLPPTALNQIARRNDIAAAEAAANLRARSEASARAADNMREARDRAREQAEAAQAAN